MRERAKILVGNREVAKRYIGSRLVWELDPLQKITIVDVETIIYGRSIVFRIVDPSPKFNGKLIKKIYIAGAQSILTIPSTSQTPELLGDRVFISNINEDIKRYFYDGGASSSNYKPMNITFLLNRKETT